MIERRALPLNIEVRNDEGGQPFIEGLAVPYRQLSQDLGGFREMFMPGAFGSDVAGLAIPALWNHDSSQVLGRSPKTMSLTDTDEGVRYRVSPPAWAAGHVETIQRGDVAGTSFGFMIEREQFVTDEDGVVIRQVLGAELVEISPVTFPAYPQTDSSVAMRSFEHWQETLKTPELDRREILQSLMERTVSSL